MLTFGFAMLISVKILKAKNVIFVVFLWLKGCSFLVLSKFKRWYFVKSTDFFVFIWCPNLKDIILNVHNWQLRQCLHDWESCNVLKQCSLVRPVLAGTAVSGLNHSTTSISLQWPPSSVPKVALEEKFNCIPIINCCWPPHQYNYVSGLTFAWRQ